MAEDTGQTPDQEGPERVPFALLIQQMRKGGLHTELGDELAGLVLACAETGKKGTLTLTLNVDPGDDGIMVVDDKIVVKAPRATPAKTLYWHDEKGNLIRNRPNQDELPFRAVKGGKGTEQDNAARDAQGEVGNA
jgi:hypothetical protein